MKPKGAEHEFTISQLEADFEMLGKSNASLANQNPTNKKSAPKDSLLALENEINQMASGFHEPPDLISKIKAANVDSKVGVNPEYNATPSRNPYSANLPTPANIQPTETSLSPQKEYNPLNSFVEPTPQTRKESQTEKVQLLPFLNKTEGKTVEEPTKGQTISESHESLGQAQGKTLSEIEDEFHGLPFIFGEAIEEESNQIIPDIKEKYEKILERDPDNDEALDIVYRLNKKQIELLKFRQALTAKVQSGDIDEEKYKQILNRALEANKKILPAAIEENLASTHLKRIQRRIDLIESEAKRIESGPNGIKESNAGTSKLPENIEEQIHQLSVINSKVKKTKESMFSAEKSLSQSHDPMFLKAKSRMARYTSLRRYLIAYFPQERKGEIDHLTYLLQRYQSIVELNKTKGVPINFVQLDSEFPEITPTNLHGYVKEKRNQAIKEHALAISQDVNSITDVLLKKTVKAYYDSILRYLGEVLNNDWVPMPKIQRQMVSVPHEEVNGFLSAGQIIFKPLKVTGSPKTRNYVVDIEFVLKDRKYKFQSDSSKPNGVFNYFKMLDLDPKKIDRYFPNLRIDVSLLKKKFFSSSVIGTSTISMKKINTMCTFVEKIPFKNETESLTLELEIQMNRAFGKGSREVNVFTILKKYPAFNFEEDHIPSPEVDIELDHLEKQDFKFPLLSIQDKNKLREIVKSKKLPDFFANFEEYLTCRGFLIEFSEELSSQIAAFRIKGDPASAKMASELLKSVSKKLNILEKAAVSGQLTPQSYLQVLVNSETAEKNLFDFFTNLKLQNAITFIKNRREILTDEISKLKQM